MKIVKVIWNDAKFYTETLSLEEVKKTKLIEIHSIGYLIDRNKERIVICSFYSPEKEESDIAGYKDNILIPVNQIKKIIKLKGG